MAKQIQDWTIGQEVKVGFMTLVVRKKLIALGDWLLTNKDCTQLYLCTPYNGCRKITTDEASYYIQIDRDTLACRDHNKKIIAEQDAARKASINALFAA